MDFLIDFVFPKRCVGCGKYEVFLCEDCEKKIELAEQICPICSKPNLSGWAHEKCKSKLGMDGLMAIWSYRNKVTRSLIEAIKFGFNRELIKIVMRNLTFETGTEFDFLVPMPLFYLRENWRGFNQAEEIAKEVEKKTKIPLVKLLVRKRNTKQQAKIERAEERKKNVKGAFVLSEEAKIQKKRLKESRVLLVDDVFTSGESMKECTRILKRVGVSKVWGLVLAR